MIMAEDESFKEDIYSYKWALHQSPFLGSLHRKMIFPAEQQFLVEPSIASYNLSQLTSLSRSLYVEIYVYIYIYIYNIYNIYNIYIYIYIYIYICLRDRAPWQYHSAWT